MKRGKHIVIVTPYYAPAWAYGGPPKVLSLFAEELVRRGYRVSVITTDALDEKRNSILRQVLRGVRVFRFRTISNVLSYHQKIFFVPSLRKHTRKILDTADAVLFGDLRSILNWQLFEEVMRRGIPYGVFAFGQIPYDKGWKKIIKIIFDACWVSRFVRRASWRFAQTEHEQSMYNVFFHIPKRETQLLLLPVQLVERQSVRPHKQQEILSVGRFHYLKGMDITLSALIPLLRAQRNYKLVFVGRDDGFEHALKQMVPPDLYASVLFPGAQYGDEVRRWYGRASCFVSTPRYYEETSTAALEALSMGCPVVTVPQAEIPFLSEYHAGLRVVNRKKNIRQAVQKVLKTRSLMGRNARKLFYGRYRCEKVTTQLLSYIYAN